MNGDVIAIGSLIDLRNISVKYTTHNILENFSCSINESEYVVILGENGSGKSTLVKTILGLIAPSSGEIVFSGDMHKNDIGYLPQITKNQRDFPASAYEIIMSGSISHCGLRPFYSKADRKYAEEIIQKLNIEKIYNKHFGSLSGGQAQRVLLARAMVAARKLLILDEPVAGLDPVAANDLYETLFEINHKEKMAIVMVSHDTAAAMKYADKIIHISNNYEYFIGDREAYVQSEVGRKYINIGGCG